MKRFALLGTLALCLSLSSCQCANKPPIGPVEDESQQAHLNVMEVPAHPALSAFAKRA